MHSPEKYDIIHFKDNKRHFFDMRKIPHPEDLTPKEFATLIETDPDFRNEMLRRQAAAVDRIEAERREWQRLRENKPKVLGTKFLSPYLTDETVFYGGGCSDHFIKTASVQELQKAVRKKRLSDTRFRIEMKRRRNRAYYDNMPDRTYQRPNPEGFGFPRAISMST